MTNILDRISSPDNLKQLTHPELVALASELRAEIIKTVSSNGGHLASSLGVVELTIALHRIFTSPTDKIIWDVGHQTYAHKILTGRKDRFATIRQFEGLSGFPSPRESVHDAFVTGHAGTSISAALGMALARDLNHDQYQVVAVIGDGALGTGMAFEAVNHAGHRATKLIVVLNDNGMSISPTQGALSHLLNQVRLDSRLETAKKGIKRAFNHLPLGSRAWRLSKQAKSGLERVLLPNAFWEEMGFVYLGPLDGHNIRGLEAALTRARDYESRPVIIHVRTVKGKGYPPAEDDAVKYHGISPPVTPSENCPSSYSQVFGQTIQRLMRENPKIVAISAAMLDGTGLAAAAAEFPQRVIDVGICEQHAVTMAAGLASQGFLPVVAVYSTFLQRAYDQIIHDVCLPALPVVFAIDRAGIVGEDGATHQGAYDISYLSAIPNLAVSAPKDENELQHLLYTALSANRPMAVRYPRGNGQGAALDPELHTIEIGRAEVLQEGKSLVILAIGSTVYAAMEAARILRDKGLDCAVINARFAKPLDSKTILQYAQECGRLVTVEENALAGGFGSAVQELLNRHGPNIAQMECIGLPDRFIEHGSQELFRAKFDLDARGIIRRIKLAWPDLWA